MALEMSIQGQGTFRFPDDTEPAEAEALIRRDFPEMFERVKTPASFTQRESGELARHEGVVLDREGQHKSYNDDKGNLTGGIGHLLSDDERKKYPLGTMIPEGVVNRWFTSDKSAAKKSLDKLLKRNSLEELPDEAKQVLFNMTFNLGEEGIEEFDDMWSAYSRNDFMGAAKAMRESNWFTQVGSRGADLVSRVEALSNPSAALPGTKFTNNDGIQKEKEETNVEN